jgi:hypothetical protein
MVLLKTTLLAALLVVVGVLLLTVIGPYITMEVQVVQNHAIEPHAEFLVGDYVDRSYALPGSVSVFGTIDAIQAPTNQSGDIRFLVFDATNYQEWVAGQQSNFIYSANQQGPSNFTFTTPGNGVYHFVFDNRASLYKKYVTFSASYSETSTSRQPDPRTPSVGWALLAVGLIVLAYGIGRKSRIPWA